MREAEFRKNMYKGNSYKCAFCGKTIVDSPTLTLSVCKGMSAYNIADICDRCVDKIKEKVVL